MFGRLAANAAPNAIRILKNIMGTGTLRQAAMGFGSAWKAAGGMRGIRGMGQGLRMAGRAGYTMGGVAGAGIATAGAARGMGAGLMANPRFSMGMRMGFGSIGKWAMGSPPTIGARLPVGQVMGRGAARVGGAVAAADFLNPWGLGWGD